MKCNHEGTLLTSLAHLGARFDCASPSEIERVLALNVPASNIIYANPCKRVRDLLYAQACGVGLTTLDTYYEIDKIADACTEGGMAVLLRIFASDPNAQCVLSNKFGANEPDWRRMLVHMKERGLHCAGVSFHVGSGACTPSAFSSAIASAAAAFELARETGHSPNILDIGGGFSLSTMDDLAPVVNEAIETHFGDQPDIQIIAEPGRLFAEHSAAFAVQIIGMRESVTTEKRQYWITDGLYGSFNCVLFDHAVIQSPIVLKKDGSLADDSGGALETADVFGATCDGLDTVSRDIKIPRAEVGDWLLFPDMGAYTIAGATTFNGILFNQVRTFDA